MDEIGDGFCAILTFGAWGRRRGSIHSICQGLSKLTPNRAPIEVLKPDLIITVRTKAPM